MKTLTCLEDDEINIIPPDVIRSGQIKIQAKKQNEDIIWDLDKIEGLPHFPGDRFAS